MSGLLFGNESNIRLGAWQTAASWSYPVDKKISILGSMNVGVGVFKHSAVGNNIRPGSCLLPAPAPYSALAPGSHMMLHRMNTGGEQEQQQLYWYKCFWWSRGLMLCRQKPKSNSVLFDILTDRIIGKCFQKRSVDEFAGTCHLRNYHVILL